MTQFVNVPSTPYFRDQYAAVSRGEPCPLVRAAEASSAAIRSATSIIEAIASQVDDSAITVTGTPENKRLIGGIVFTVPGRAYAVCGGDRTLFIDLNRPHQPQYDMPPELLAQRLLDCSAGLESTSTQWALISDDRDIRDLRSIDELADAAARHSDIAEIIDRAGAFADHLHQAPVGLSLPRLALERLDGGIPVGLVVDYGTITHAITTGGVMPVPACSA